MESLLANVATNVSYEVVAAAGLAVGSVAAAAVFSCRKRRRDRDGDVTTGLSASPRGSSKKAKKKRQQAKKKAAAAGETAEAHGSGLDAEIPVDSYGIPQETVVDALKRHVRSKLRNTIAYTFLDDYGKEVVNYTFEEVDLAARRIAATLQSDAGVRKGDRVILCYPPGVDFHLGFWGCLYAGVVAVPVYPPYPGTLAKDLPKFNRMVEDSDAKVILTNRTYHLASRMATIKSFFSVRRDKNEATTWPEHVQWITTDSIADSAASLYDEVAADVKLNDLAFFQYSSGSTSLPKAVMVSHGNVRAQLRTWETIIPGDTLVSWVPSYHDMGLVGFVIAPVTFGARCVSMSPISFIKDPTLWVRVITEYQGTQMVAPNFGYALVARKTSNELAKKMDLSHIKQACCAAEPIREEAIFSFIAKFQNAAGFNPGAFNCGYGMAEATLVITGQTPLEHNPPIVLHVNKKELEANKRAVIVSQKEALKKDNVMTFIGCGFAALTFNVKIVDPKTKKILPDGHVGEIWAQGPSVAQGYWHQPEYTKEMFGATVYGETDPTNTWLRTGDLAFFHQGQTFITGRVKDLIIIRGRNVCPQDIEFTAEHAHDRLRQGCSAAFSIEKNNEEVLVIVIEVRNGTPQETMNEICREISRSVLNEHQLRCEAVVLLRQKTICKTTSGKIQRGACKAKYLENSFSRPWVVYHPKERAYPPETPVKAPEAEVPVPAPASDTPVAPADGDIKSPEEILKWLVDRLAQEVIDAEDDGTANGNAPSAPKIDPKTPFADYGLDSVAVVGLSSELGEFLGCVVPPAAFFQYDSPEKLAAAPGLATGAVEVSGEELIMSAPLAKSVEEIDESCFNVAAFPEVQNLEGQMKEFEEAGLRVPFLETLTPEKRRMINFNTYNYLGNASNPEVAAAAKKAIDDYGTTMSSSPIVGQTQINVELEKTLCEFFQAEAAVLYVGGWVTNVTTIDALVGKGDLILCDALNHDSCVTGQRLSGATVLPYPHNDTEALERMLTKVRLRYRRVLIVTEGVYSMDGDVPDLKEIVRIKKEYKCMLFVDEAHSFGTIGATGRGLCEHCGVDPSEVDVRMGTMSKSLGSVGGFILGTDAVIKYLKHCSGGFVFSVGLSPAHAAASLRSVQLMLESPANTQKLQEHSAYFFDLCKQANVPVGATTCRGAPVVVVMTGTTLETAMASQYLATKAQINVKPIVYPAVEEGKGRLRFFISAVHTKEQLEFAVLKLTEYLKDPKAAIQEMLPNAAKLLAASAAHATNSAISKQTSTTVTVVTESNGTTTSSSSTSVTTVTATNASTTTTVSKSSKKRKAKKNAKARANGGAVAAS